MARRSRAFDVAILGSGFGGSLLAMIARRLGRSVVVLERGTHPRFAIGESSTPLANLLLRELAVRYDLPRLLPLTEWGPWQRTYPEVACGLKRGFSFYNHESGRPLTDRLDRRDQLLVAASPRDELADTHWYRPDFDHFLVREAQALGAEYLDEVRLESFTPSPGGARIEGGQRGRRLAMTARLTIDATGPRGFLHRMLSLPERPFRRLPPTQGLYTHFMGVSRLDELGVGVRDETPPFPIDDAAVHHVFDGGWIWVLRFNNGVTSAGVAATAAHARELRLADGAPAWQRLLERLPTVRAQFANAEPRLDFVHAPRLSFRSGAVAGPNWALLPFAAGFVDPLLSTGFSLTLLGIERLAGAIERDWGSPRLAKALQVYAARTTHEMLETERLIAALYARMHDFRLFRAVSLLYFAAISFAEMARRLGRPGAADSFLLERHPAFGPEARAILEQTRRALTPTERRALLARIPRAIEPVDVTGLGDSSRRHWYPADPRDTLEAAAKLGATRDEVARMLARQGLS